MSRTLIECSTVVQNLLVEMEQHTLQHRSLALITPASTLLELQVTSRLKQTDSAYESWSKALYIACRAFFLRAVPRQGVSALSRPARAQTRHLCCLQTRRLCAFKAYAPSANKAYVRFQGLRARRKMLYFSETGPRGGRKARFGDPLFVLI